MKDISIYFEPISNNPSGNEYSLLNELIIHDEKGFPEIEGPGVAIIHVPEYRNSETPEASSSDKFVSELTNLYKGDSWDFNLYYLGTIKPGERIEDSYFAVAQVVSELVKADIVPVVVGGSDESNHAVIWCCSIFMPN